MDKAINYTKVRLKVLRVTTAGADFPINIYEEFNRLLDEEKNDFHRGDDIWTSLHDVWDNKKKSLGDYLDSMKDTYDALKNDKAFEFMSINAHKHASLCNKDNPEWRASNCIKLDSENVVYKGRHRIILFHYMLKEMNISNDVLISIPDEDSCE